MVRRLLGAQWRAPIWRIYEAPLANSHCIAALVALPVLALGTGCLDRELGPLNPCVVSGVVEGQAATLRTSTFYSWSITQTR